MRRTAEATPTGGFATSPSRGEGSAAHVIIAETAADVGAREMLLDRAMGAGRKRKSSEKLRRGRRPSEGLAFVARDADEHVVGTVRLWDVRFAVSPLEGEMGGSPEGVTSEGTADMQRTAALTPPGRFAATLPPRGRDKSALLLGPLAVDPSVKSAGIGSALMLHAIAEAKRLGHGAILLVGDAPYYARFGFSAEKTGRLAMPGPYERHRFLALELAGGALDGAHGVLRPAGRKVKAHMELARAA
ncbi:GNAT family N-acetyltransferase [Mesorhizobium yinganensis]|uniref:GNAT family N-acetyltransferase n=1 Tax=Mesorhizobium yinganensis TaxID=3157707 RepID=UPI003CCDFBAF